MKTYQSSVLATPVPISVARILLPGESVRPVPKASGYWASSHGRIISTKGKQARVLKSSIAPGHPYPFVELQLDRSEPTKFGRDTKRRTLRVHRIVAEAWYGLPPDEPGVTYDVHHIDGDPQNNTPSNLEYLDRSRHCMVTIAQGQHPSAKLTPREVWIARCDAYLEGTHSVVERLEAEKGMHSLSVRRALRGQSWAAVPMPRDQPTAEQLAQVLSVPLSEAEHLLAFSPFVTIMDRSAA